MTWAGIPAPTATDWVALAAVGAGDINYVAYVYTNGAAAGSLSIQVPAGAAPGQDQIRIYAQGTYQRLATSSPITVTP